MSRVSPVHAAKSELGAAKWAFSHDPTNPLKAERVAKAEQNYLLARVDFEAGKLLAVIGENPAALRRCVQSIARGTHVDISDDDRLRLASAVRTGVPTAGGVR